MPKEFESFRVGQKAILIRDGKCLIVECADRPNVWDLPGGRIDKNEEGEEAFRREIKEETGLDNFAILAVADYAIIYWRNDFPMCGVANLIKNDHDTVTLSFEHSSYRWIAESEIDGFEYIWPSMARMIKNGFKYYKLFQVNAR
ncbi:hypothetical protein A2477_00680 [Candidatus Falkowbacteria bacterium RIFOXYC2_FULL_47_12]|uniref:Nudix hydrolase domain-containing protein n=2 Tax=Candidatus Falkowiibacteriota TaxID=1752728 RepID=A0A1F5TLT7_9BACT|nr:MAG: hypothetical protein A2242_00600 [Candidatus Falkowbacteria bacterium RIFOXYA2_FULL_47_9]OGF39880.1 MAG: hypothetical protein A2477_00680 [Candidatus Falkowbacteria bacterium RIFOXYC2_FULL_47_12]